MQVHVHPAQEMDDVTCDSGAVVLAWATIEREYQAAVLGRSVQGWLERCQEQEFGHFANATICRRMSSHWFGLWRLVWSPHGESPRPQPDKGVPKVRSAQSVWPRRAVGVESRFAIFANSVVKVFAWR